MTKIDNWLPKTQTGGLQTPVMNGDVFLVSFEYSNFL